MTWLFANGDEVWQLTLSHIALSIAPIVLGFLISIPVGWIANRYRASRGTLLSVSGILYAIPSLPLFFMLPSLLGTTILDPLNVSFGLTIYALALMVRTTADALDSVSTDVTFNATAVGFSAWRRFWSVELPLAGPVLLAGLRVVSVSTVSLVTVGSLLGVPSLGFLFIDGYQRYNPPEIIVGIVVTVVIALAFDALIVLAGRALMPWNRGVNVSRARRAAARTVSAS